MSMPPRFLGSSNSTLILSGARHVGEATQRLTFKECIALPCAIGLLAFGALASMGSKGMLNAKGVGLDGLEKFFVKPWFINVFMYMGLSLTLPLHYLHVASNLSSLRGQDAQIDSESLWDSLIPSAYVVGCSAMLAALNCLGLALARTGLQQLSTSVWEMMRGSRMVFNAAFAVSLLSSTLSATQWKGIKVSCVGVSIVGVAALMKAQGVNTQSTYSAGARENYGTISKGIKIDTDLTMQAAAKQISEAEEQHADSTFKRLRPVLTGVSFTLLGSSLNALEYTLQDHMLHSVNTPEKLMLGLQGCWGLFYMLFIVCPLMSWIPGSDNGCKEDAADAIQMVRSSRSIQNWILFFVFGDVCANIAGVEVTAVASAVTRSEVDVMRPLLLMITGLLTYYFVDSRSPFAESWSHWDLLRLFGFVFVMLGAMMYGGVIDAEDTYLF